MRGAMTTVLALALVAAPAAAQETELTEREVVALLAEGAWTERLEALNVALKLGPRASPELRLAVIDAAWAELRGGTDTPPEQEAMFDYLDAVVGLRDSRAIPLLVEVLGNGSAASNALADFGTEAFPAVLAAVSDPGEHPYDVFGGLTTLRFLLEDGALTAGQAERVRGVVRDRLSGTQDGFPLKAAIRLAVALGDSGLRATVERIAVDRAFAAALVSPILPDGSPTDHAYWVDQAREHARIFLSGGGADIGPVRRPGSG